MENVEIGIWKSSATRHWSVLFGLSRQYLHSRTGFAVYEEAGDTCMVHPFSEKYKPLRVKIVNAVIQRTLFVKV